MWRVIAIVFSAAFVVGPVGIEILRSVVHARRERQRGIGGPQDIAMWGTFALIGCATLAAISWAVWLAER